METGAILMRADWRSIASGDERDSQCLEESAGPREVAVI